MGRRGQRERGEQGEQGGRRRGEGKGRLQCSQGAYVMRAGMFTSRGFFGPDPSTPPPSPPLTSSPLSGTGLRRSRHHTRRGNQIIFNMGDIFILFFVGFLAN